MSNTIQIPASFESLNNLLQEPLRAIASQYGVILSYDSKGVRMAGYELLPDNSQCPSSRIKAYLKARSTLIRTSRSKHLDAFGIEAIIRHEILNQDALSTGSLVEVRNAISAYDVPEKMLTQIFSKMYMEAYQ